LVERKEFLRTPARYGYATINYAPSKRFVFSANLVYTGKMDLVHLGGAPEQKNDAFKTSEAFNSLGLKMTYIQKLDRVGASLEYSFGVKNLTNAFQNNFDTGKNRDSNFVYGPMTPRIFYFALALKSL